MTALIWFLLGFTAGVVCFYAAATYYIKKLTVKRSKELAQLIDNMKNEFVKLKGQAKAASKLSTDVKDRMARVREITEEQIDIRSRVDGPQRSALDGKHKNSLIRQSKALDEEKYELLNSILKDGVDPVISTVDEEGNVEELKLSKFLMDSGRLTAPVPGSAPAEPEKELPPNAKRVGKFVVYSKATEDSGDGGTTH